MIRAWYHDEQAAYSPGRALRFGQVVPARDQGERTLRLLDALDRVGARLERPTERPVDALQSIHSPDYLQFLETVWTRWSAIEGHGPEVWPNYFPYINGRADEPRRRPCPTRHLTGQVGWYLGDLSAPFGADAWLSAKRSAETALAAADAVVAGEARAYALCRPSGHHARADRAAGACYLNNAALAASRLATRFQRIAILDVDAHHGDGTQQLFYHRADVLTVSLHADPRDAYPYYSGYADETGHGAGLDCNLNLPLPIGAQGDAFGAALTTAMAAIRRFEADALIVALGFDGHHDDPVRLGRLEADDYARVSALVDTLRLPTLLVQEGGYSLSAIGDCLGATLNALG